MVFTAFDFHCLRGLQGPHIAFSLVRIKKNEIARVNWTASLLPHCAHGQLDALFSAILNITAFGGR